MVRYQTWASVCLACFCAWFGTPLARAQKVAVNVESTPSGATVYLDSVDSAPLGNTPLNRVRIAKGNHTLIFRLVNFSDARLPVNVQKRKETFRVTMTSVAVVSVNAGNDATQGATVRIDGQQSGTVPFRNEVAPGRHLIQVSKDGYVTYNQWVDLSGGQVLALPVILEREQPRSGSLLVAGDLSGASVYVDGQLKGTTPTVVENLSEGMHTVEVRPAEGGTAFRQDVHIAAGERGTLNPTMRSQAVAEKGTVRVLCNVQGAVISIDGEVIGPSPAVRENVAAGEHIVEARAEGYALAQQPVTVEAGRQRVVTLQLTQEAPRPGKIVVNASVEGARVTVDGEDRGAPPVVIENATQGTHAIAVRAEGFQEFRTVCEIRHDRNCEVRAQMEPVGTPVRVETNAPGAHFYSDGDLRGPIPWEGRIPVGEHRFEIRAPGYRSHVEQVNLVAANTTRSFNVALVKEGDLTEEERAEVASQRDRDVTGAVSHSADPLPKDLAAVDMSLGWPHLAEVRLNVGILSFLGAGFATRSFGRLTEFEGRVQAGHRFGRQVGVGGQVRFGGGLGPSRAATGAEKMEAAAMGKSADRHPINTLFMSLEAMGTLHFSEAGAFSLWVALDMYTDRYDWEGGNSDRIDASADGSRQKQSRMRLGGALELALSRHWNIWGILEGILVSPDKTRRILGDIYNFNATDTKLYFRLGATYKF